jgi:hypothetical protein
LQRIFSGTQFDLLGGDEDEWRTTEAAGYIAAYARGERVANIFQQGIHQRCCFTRSLPYFVICSRLIDRVDDGVNGVIDILVQAQRDRFIVPPFLQRDDLMHSNNHPISLLLPSLLQ